MLRTTGALVGAGTGATLLGGAPAEAQQTVDFGEVSDGSSDVRTVSQPNPTGRPLPVTGIEITGTDAAQFSVVRGDESVTLQPDESHTIAVRFAPTSPGEKSAAIRVAIAGGSSRTAGQLARTGVSEATDGTTADSSSTSTEETNSAESTSDAGGDATGRADGASGTTTDGSDGESQSPRDDSATDGTTGPSTDEFESPSVEESAAPELETTRSPRADADDGRSPVTIGLDSNGDGTVDVRDLVALVRLLG